MTEHYEVVLTRAARRALSETLPDAAVSAAFEFITGTLAENPRSVGKPLREPLAPLYSSRRQAQPLVEESNLAATRQLEQQSRDVLKVVAGGIRRQTT